MGRYCLDASFALGLVLPGQSSLAPRKQWSAFSQGDELVAPALLWAECTSVLREHVHRRLIAPALASDSLRLLLSLPIRLVDQPETFARALHIAGQLNWPKAYDAVYLAVAELQGAELLTLDRGMRSGAQRLSIASTLVTP